MTKEEIFVQLGAIIPELAKDSRLVKQLKRQVEELATRVGNTPVPPAGNSGGLTNPQPSTDLSQINNTLAALSLKLTTLEGQIANLPASHDYSTDIANLTTSIESIKLSIQLLKQTSPAPTPQGNVKDYDSVIETINQSITTIKTKLDNLPTPVDYSEKITELETKVTTLSNTVASLNLKLTTLENQLAKVQELKQSGKAPSQPTTQPQQPQATTPSQSGQGSEGAQTQPPSPPPAATSAGKWKSLAGIEIGDIATSGTKVTSLAGVELGHVNETNSLTSLGGVVLK